MLRLHLTQSCALLLGVALLFSVSTVCLAQESRGSITGKVADPQNAVVPGAAVVVTNTATNVSGNATTNQTGYFEVGFLVPGTYSVSVESAGFKKFVQTGITLDTGDRLALNLKLEIGQTTPIGGSLGGCAVARYRYLRPRPRPQHPRHRPVALHHHESLRLAGHGRGHDLHRRRDAR